MIQNVKFSTRHWSRETALTAIAIWIFVGLTTSLAETQPAKTSLVLPSDTDIRKILVERIGGEEGSAGIIVGVIDPQGRRIISCGHRNAGDPRMPVKKRN